MTAGLSIEYSDIIQINNKTIDYKTEHKINNFKNYEKFYKNCSENFF
jgi:N-acetyl-gamma-glutamylphosphate reductase